MKNKNLFIITCLILGFGLITGSCRNRNPQVKSNIREEIYSNKDSFFYLDIQHYPIGDKSLPVGIFDSGTGGLTILDAIVHSDKFNNASNQYKPKGDGKPDFNSESFIYLGDQANMPYGNYAAENNTSLLKEHIFKDVQFLMGNKYYLNAKDPGFRTDKRSVKAIVIACNTATAVGEQDIISFFDSIHLDMKVIGVIDAAVKAALRKLDRNEDAGIAVMATAGTVATMGYVKTIRSELDENQFKGKINIHQQAGVGIAGAIDGVIEFIDTNAVSPRQAYAGPSVSHSSSPINPAILNRYGFDWTGNHMLFTGEKDHPENIQINSIENYISYHLVSLLEQLKKEKNVPPLKVIILGCTHYPFYLSFFKEKLQQLYNYREDDQYVYRDLMVQNPELVDPAQYTAEELYRYLAEKKIIRSGTHMSESAFFISVPNMKNPAVLVDSSGNFTYQYKYGRKPGSGQQYVRRVPFSDKTVPPEVMARLNGTIPVTYKLIRQWQQVVSEE